MKKLLLFVSSVGIPLWVVGRKKINRTEIALVKYKFSGSTSINGIGFKVRF